MSKEDAEVVVVLAAALHDIGHAVHRDNHEEFSVALWRRASSSASWTDLYPRVEMTTVMVEVLHAMITHRSDLQPLTLEASVVRVGGRLGHGEGQGADTFQRGERQHPLRLRTGHRQGLHSAKGTSARSGWRYA